MNFNDETPIYIQIAEAIEDGILNEIYEEESQIPSTTEISINYKINPATIRKGFDILVNEGISYKKRGLGMFVVKGARNMLKIRRKNGTTPHFLEKGIRKYIMSDENTVSFVGSGDELLQNFEQIGK